MGIASGAGEEYWNGVEEGGGGDIAFGAEGEEEDYDIWMIHCFRGVRKGG